MRDRARLMAVSLMLEKSNFKRAEERFRDNPDEKTYKNLRAAFSTMIGQKVCLEYLKKKEASMTEAQHAAEKARKETAEEYFIETYHLSEEDLREIEEMVEKPVQCIDIRCLQQTA